MKTRIRWLWLPVLVLMAGCAPQLQPAGETPLATGLPAPTEATQAPTALAPDPTSSPLPEGTAGGAATAAATATGAASATAPAAGPTATANLPPNLLGLPQVEQARADLAMRLSVAPAAIDVLNVEARTWSDASMGCPQPGMAYLQVPQDGLLVVLGHAGVPYAYHSGGAMAPFLCEPNLAGEKTTPIFGEDILTRPAP